MASMTNASSVWSDCSMLCSVNVTVNFARQDIDNCLCSG